MANSKQKGNRHEREISHILQDHGFNARRTNQYCGKTEESSDVIGLPGFHIECKHYKTKAFDYKWHEQAKRDCKDNIPIVIHRTDRHENMVTMALDDFLKIIGDNK